MKLLYVLPALSVAAASAIAVKPISYDGYKVFRVPVGDDVDEVNRVASQLRLQVWKPASGARSFADFAVPPDQLAAFERALGLLQLQPTVMNDDLGASIAQESSFDIYAARSANTSWFSSYHSWADHVQFLEDLEDRFPNNAKVVSSGLSVQGNNITGIHLYGKSGGGQKPAIVFHATVHAREWITAMVVEYVAYTLLHGYGSDSDTKATQYLDKFDFYLFPVVNVDGFIYTQTTDRMWRKNRQINPGSSCVGRDMNRNWPYQWNITMGASDNPCAEDYRGLKPGDAPEIQALADFLLDTQRAQGIKLYIDFHSYSQLLMTPYSYACDVLPANEDEYERLGKGTAAAIKAVHGAVYKEGPVCSTIYPASGGSIDYTADVVGVGYNFAIELRDLGKHGFVLPADQILPSGEETYAGISYLLDNVQ